MISFLSQAHDSPPFSRTQLQLKESWKRRQGEKEGVGSLGSCKELAVVPRGGASPSPCQAPAFGTRAQMALEKARCTGKAVTEGASWRFGTPTPTRVHELHLQRPGI